MWEARASKANMKEATRTGVLAKSDDVSGHHKQKKDIEPDFLGMLLWKIPWVFLRLSHPAGNAFLRARGQIIHTRDGLPLPQLGWFRRLKIESRQQRKKDNNMNVKITCIYNSAPNQTNASQSHSLLSLLSLLSLSLSLSHARTRANSVNR